MSGLSGWSRAVVLVAAILVALPAGAAAQSNGVDFAAGYAFSRITNDDGVNFPIGWFASVGGNISDMLAIVGEVNGAYKTLTTTVPNATVTAKLRMHSFLVGPRWRSASGKARGFGQILVGAERDSGSATATILGVTESDGASETNLAIAPGAGVDINLSGNTGLRLGANFRLVNGEGEWGKVFQFVAGVVWGKTR